MFAEALFVLGQGHRKKLRLPRKSASKAKYTKKEFFSKQPFENMNLPENIKETLTKKANNALADKTKGVYSTAERMLLKCGIEYNMNVNFPLDEEKLLLFIGWNIEKGLSEATIRSYLSGLKKASTAKGFGDLNNNTPLINEVLRGHKDKVLETSEEEDSDNEGGQSKKKRLPCTLPTLRLLKKEIANSKLSKDQKIVLWAVASTATFGAFRIGELLLKSTLAYHPKSSLLKSDIKIVKGNSKGEVHITIKTSKTNNHGPPETVIIYERGDNLYPLKAMVKLKAITRDLPADAPAFVESNGRPYTQKALNAHLKLLTGKLFSKGALTGHSFRAGLITMLARSGYPEEVLKQIGRWSSRAYLCYIKHGRTTRQEAAKACANL